MATNPTRSTQRSVQVHAGGRCELHCAVCDCAQMPSPREEIARALEGGGARIVIRGATENSAVAADVVARARQQGFAEVVVRSNALGGAAAVTRLAADVVLVPLFSQIPAAHDRIAGRPRALLETLAGMKSLARAGFGIEIEVPILSPQLQRLKDVVTLAQRAVPSLRGVRFFVPPFPVPDVLAPPSWEIGEAPLAEALQRCRDLGVKARLSGAEGVPLCALRDHADLHDVYAFNPKARSSKHPSATFGEVCAGCAVRPQCPGILPSYGQAHAERGIRAYAQRPSLMYEQRTTRRRTWTPTERAAAARAELLVLRPTVNCNQDCTFCSANETSSNVWESKEVMLRAIARAARRRLRRLSFSGGEPTLSKYLVDYVHCASRLGVEDIEIVSNAVLLDRKEKVEALVAAGLTHAFISLHAHDERLSQQSTQKVGDFARTMQGIKNLVAAGVRTSLNHVITARNYSYLVEYVELVQRELGGRVHISFAFVTPQFKALDNIEVMPRLSDVMPYLKRAMYRAIEIGQPFGIGSRQGIPFCFLDEFRAWSDGINMSQAALSEDAPQKQRAAVCDECRFSNYCVGLWRPYAAKYGFDELRPVAGARMTDEEANAVRTQLMALPWDVPRSFDDVPEQVRERALEIGPPDLAPAPPALALDAPGRHTLQRTRPLRVALLGSGRQARRLARAASHVSGLSIDAVASPHAPQAEIEELGNCPAYSDAAEALDDIRPEAVIVAAATSVHDELARLAIARAIPALIEKPLTATEEQAEALLALARDAGVVVVPAHNSVHATGLDRIFATRFQRPSVSYVCRRTAASSDTMRTWSRMFFYETIYHLLAVVGRACGGGTGAVVNVLYRGESRPERVRIELVYGAAHADITLDFTAAIEEDVLVSRDAELPESTLTWRRQGRAVTLADASGVHAVESRGSDVECMLANFRDVVLGHAQPGATIEEALHVMRTARLVVDAVAVAGAPFERPNAPKHVASRALQQPLQ